MISRELWRHGPIRERDADETLLAAGYRWDQFGLLEKLAFGGLAVAGLLLAPFMYVGHSPQAGVVFVAASLAMLIALRWIGKRPRMIVFTRRGRVMAPNGIADRFGVRDLGPIAQVSSIELTSSCQDFGVVLFTTEGRTILIAERMRKVDARLIAVQLTKALHEMRQSLATIAGQRGQSARPMAEAWVH